MSPHHGPAPVAAQPLSEYLETHAAGGTDAVVAGCVLVLGGAGIAWHLVRRARLRDEAAFSTPDRGAPPAAQDGPTRVRARLTAHPTPAEAAPGPARTAPASRDRVDAAVPPIEIAALVVLEAQLRARARALTAHRAGGDPTAVPVPRFCSLNPFHGQTTVTAEQEAASAAVAVCVACRDALAAGETPDMLRVRTRGGVLPCTEAETAYARGFAGGGDELVDAVQEPPVSGPAGRAEGTRRGIGAAAGAIAVPVLLLVLAAVVGMVASILLADRVTAAADAGPTVLGYPLLNGMRGAAIGVLGALLFAGIAAAALIGLRHRRTPASMRDGYDPHRRSELEQTAVEENIRRLRER